jgi:hypothetical protein
MHLAIALTVFSSVLPARGLNFSPIPSRDAARSLSHWRINEPCSTPLSHDLQHFSDWMWDTSEDEERWMLAYSATSSEEHDAIVGTLVRNNSLRLCAIALRRENLPTKDLVAQLCNEWPILSVVYFSQSGTYVDTTDLLRVQPRRFLAVCWEKKHDFQQ